MFKLSKFIFDFIASFLMSNLSSIDTFNLKSVFKFIIWSSIKLFWFFKLKYFFNSFVFIKLLSDWTNISKSEISELLLFNLKFIILLSDSLLKFLSKNE